MRSIFAQSLTTALLFSVVYGLSAAEPRILIDRDRITVSGISAGGQMAHQLHIAYSDWFSGVGIIAGGPYGCAEGSLALAMGRCMGKTDGTYVVSEQVNVLQEAVDEGLIANTDHLENDRVWLFHGVLDTVVAPQLSESVADLYAEYLPAENIRYVHDIQAAHHFPASGVGHACDISETPFVGNCEFDAAGEILQFLYGDLTDPGAKPATPLVESSLPGAKDASLAESVWLFIPTACTGTDQGCAFHLVLHGCAQAAEQVGKDFIEQSGYLQWAAANDIVLAFPQVVAGATNPFACWDWWGYTGANYRWRESAQMSVLVDWIETLSVAAD